MDLWSVNVKTIFVLQSEENDIWLEIEQDAVGKCSLNHKYLRFKTLLATILKKGYRYSLNKPSAVQTAEDEIAGFV